MFCFGEDQPSKILVQKRFPNQTTGIFDLSTVIIDRYNNTVIKAEKVLKPNPVFKVLLTVVDLHYGKFGGLTTKILYVFIGLMPTILLVTGLMMWKQRRWFKARREATKMLEKQS